MLNVRLQLWNPGILLRSCVWPLIAGFAINNVVPFRAGDPLRVLGFQGQVDTPLARLLGSLLIEDRGTNYVVREGKRMAALVREYLVG